MSNRVVALWSGGVDSTAVVAQLLARSYEVHAVSLRVYDKRAPKMDAREAEARRLLLPFLGNLARACEGALTHESVDASWIWEFSIGQEIPRRNKLMMDWLVANRCVPLGIRNLGVGEYVGADTWLVRDHVAASDADHRYLSAYLLQEYGLDYRLISLQDFGESRYKSDRVTILAQHLPEQALFLTTNCLRDVEVQCGNCYKCVERAAAFRVALGFDSSRYALDPRGHLQYGAYRRQMSGENITVRHSEF